MYVVFVPDVRQEFSNVSQGVLQRGINAAASTKRAQRGATGLRPETGAGSLGIARTSLNHVVFGALLTSMPVCRGPCT